MINVRKLLDVETTELLKVYKINVSTSAKTFLKILRG